MLNGIESLELDKKSDNENLAKSEIKQLNNDLLQNLHQISQMRRKIDANDSEIEKLKCFIEKMHKKTFPRLVEDRKA